MQDVARLSDANTDKSGMRLPQLCRTSLSYGAAQSQGYSHSLFLTIPDRTFACQGMPVQSGQNRGMQSCPVFMRLSRNSLHWHEIILLGHRPVPPGEPLEGERPGDEPVDDGIHAPLARRRTSREGMARGAVGIAAVGEVLQSLLLGGVHADGPVAVKIGVIPRGWQKKAGKPFRATPAPRRTIPVAGTIPHLPVHRPTPTTCE